ncbi:MAG: hypothetical protein ABWK04_03355 [Hydrogenobacter sp.]
MAGKKKGKVAYGDNLYEIHGSYWLIFTHHDKTYTERIGRVKDLPLTMARNIAVKRKAEIIEGTYLPKKEENLTFEELAKEYLSWYKSTRPQVRKRTLYDLEKRIDRLVGYFGGMQVHQISTLQGTNPPLC